MDGVILFADDELSTSEFESGLYTGLKDMNKYPVLGITNLDLLRTSIVSLSSLKALIVDWNFQDGEAIEGLGNQVPERLAMEILNDPTINIFSLIYVYSRNEIENTENGIALKEKFGSRIIFRLKASSADKISEELAEISRDIDKWENDHKHLTVPFVWSKTINQAVQSIFGELNDADPNWIKDLYYSSVRKTEADGSPKVVEVNPEVQVINLFQYLLSEKLIQNTELRNSIQEFSIEHFKDEQTEESAAKLFKRLYYTPTPDTDILMTGDIFNLDADEFGILISPECDIMFLKTKKMDLEFLCFKKDDFKKIGIANHFKTDEEQEKAFNQERGRFQVLPSFPFVKDDFSTTAFIDFRSALRQINVTSLNYQKRSFKVNSPYIQQLRQRYLAYVGRVGVPAIPHTLVAFNLK